VADEYLPPVVTKLKGDVHDLLDAIGEAKAAMAAYDKQVGDDSERASTSTGRRSAQALVASLKRTLAESRVGDTDTAQLRGDIDTAFRMAGKKSGASLLLELQKALGDGGMGSDVGRQLTDSFTKFGSTTGMDFGQSFGTAAQGTWAKAFAGGLTSPAGIAAITAAAVALGPLAGAAIGGGIEGSLGFGTMLAGALVQLKTNPQVQGAAKDFGSWLSTEFKDDTAVFAGPLIDAFKLLQTDTRGPMDDLRKDFAAVAPYVRDFATYLGAAEEKFMPGFNRMIQSSGPIITELGHGLVYVADGLNVMFDEISKGGKGEVEGLDVLFRTLGGTLSATGFLIRGLADAFDFTAQIADKVTGAQAKYLGWIPGVGDYFREAHKEWDGIVHSFDDSGSHVGALGGEMNTLTSDLDRQRAAVQSLTKAWDDWFGLSMSVDQATLTLHQDVTALTDSIAQNGRTFDENTKAGQANYGALLQAIQAAHDLYDAEVKQYGDNPKFVTEYQQTVDKLLAQASAAGLDKSQIAALSSEFGQLQAALNSINGKVVHYSVIGSGSNPNSFPQGLAEGGFVGPGGIIHAAQGLLPPRSPGTLVLAGEPQTGGEWMIPRRGISQQRAAQLVAGAAADHGVAVGPAGGGCNCADRPIVIQNVLPDGRVLWEQYILPGALQTKKQWGPVGL